jgi:hypothetical protein
MKLAIYDWLANACFKLSEHTGAAWAIGFTLLFVFLIDWEIKDKGGDGL